MAEKEPKKRFKERKNRDDFDDEGEEERRSRRSRRDDDEVPDHRPRRSVGGDRPPVLFLLGLVGGAVLLLGCCGVGGWGAYTWLAGKSGGGWSLFGSNELEITQASRTQGFGFGSAPQVSWEATITAVPPTGSRHYVVMKCGGVTDVTPVEVPPFKGATLSQSMPHPALRSTAGPLEIWFERRTDPNKSGTKVSNVYAVR